MSLLLPRRRFLATGAALLGAGALAGCDRFAESAYGPRTLRLGEDANYYVQRLLLTPASLAREFPATEISPEFKPNGSIDPPDEAYKALAAANFADYALKVDGLVERPLALSLADLRGLPARTQTTRHDCVEGWSAIGRWTGAPLAEVLQRAGLKPQARYVVFHCADTLEYAAAGTAGSGASLRPRGPGDVRHFAERTAVRVAASGKAPIGFDAPGAGRVPVRYYESVDLADAFHPQTILAYDLNGQALPVANGAPLRVRVERQLGYKMAKYVMRIEVVERLTGIAGGQGGYWEDRGYEWYAGI